MLLTQFAGTALLCANLVTAQLAETDAPSSEIAEAIAPTPIAEETGLSASVDAAPAPVAAVFNDKSDDEIVQMVIDHIESIGTLKSNFSQIAPSGAVSTGTLYLRRPGQARFEYDDPSPILIVATQGRVFVQDEALDQTDQYPIKKTPLRFLLSKKIDLKGASIAQVERGEDAVAVTMASDDEDVEGYLTLVLDAPSLQLREWVVEDAQNGFTTVALSEIEQGGKLSNRLFRAPEAGGAFIGD